MIGQRDTRHPATHSDLPADADRCQSAGRAPVIKAQNADVHARKIPKSRVPDAVVIPAMSARGGRVYDCGEGRKERSSAGHHAAFASAGGSGQRLSSQKPTTPNNCVRCSRDRRHPLVMGVRATLGAVKRLQGGGLVIGHLPAR